MIKIDEQLNDLKKLFNNKNIIDQTDLFSLSDEEFKNIEDAISNNKKDCSFEISENIVITFKKGIVYLKNNIYG